MSALQFSRALTLLQLKLLFPLNYDLFFKRLQSLGVSFHTIAVSRDSLGLRSGIMKVQSKVNLYYVKYFDMDSTTLSPRELSLIPNLEGNRLTNDGKMAMKKGESDFPRDEREKRGLFIDARVFLIPKTTTMMNLKRQKITAEFRVLLLID